MRNSDDSTISIVKLVLMAVVIADCCRCVRADFTFGEPVNLGPGINTSYSDGLACIAPDGLSLYFISNRPGGSGAHDLYVVTRGSEDEEWSEPANLGGTVNSNAEEFFSCISSDGLTLYFDSTRPGGRGARDLWGTTRPSPDAAWTSPVNLGSPINSAYDDVSPNFSADGLTLLFSSSRSGGRGSYDLYICTRPSPDASWSAPANLGAPINSAYLDVAPSLSSDGLTLFFHSIRPGGFGSYDLYYSRRETLDAPWSDPVHLGHTVNSSYAELGPSLSADGRVLYFCEHPDYTPRPGGLGKTDVWQTAIIPIVDFNADGKVDLKDFSRLALYWQQDESSCDIGPNPLGDGIVDVHDVAVFAEYWLKDSRIIAHWKLDESQGLVVHDSVSGHDGFVIAQDPLWQPAGGIVNGALQLNGIDNYVFSEFDLNPAETAFSIFVWVKGGAPGQVLISQTDFTSGRTTLPGSTWLGTDPSDGRLITGLMDVQYGPLESDSVITDGEWHHVGLVYDIGALQRRLYVDGAEVARDVDSVWGVASGGSLHFGAGKNRSAGTFFAGLIDDVRIYNAALSAAEIEALAR